MKKVIWLTLLSFLLLVDLSGCSISHNNAKETTQEAETETKEVSPTMLQDSDEHVLALIKYLQELRADHDMPDTSIAIKINEVKNGKQALHVDFSSSDSYFVCAYYDDTHSDERTEYCCASEYTWVKFESESEISEQYNDNRFIVAFQVNVASFVTDIISQSESMHDMRHFQTYVPVFDHGVNIAAPLAFDRTFIYLNSSEKSTIYHTTSAYDNSWVTIPCVLRDEQYYVTVELYIVYSDGERFDRNLNAEFREYYDALRSIMDTETYHATNDRGNTVFYGVIEIGTFGNFLINSINKK